MRARQNGWNPLGDLYLTYPTSFAAAAAAAAANYLGIVVPRTAGWPVGATKAWTSRCLVRPRRLHCMLDANNLALAGVDFSMAARTLPGILLRTDAPEPSILRRRF